MTRDDGSTRNTVWDGVALRRVRAAADPDANPRPVALPAAWDDTAAEALAALAPGNGPVALPRLAEAWIARLAARGRKLGLLADAAAAESLATALRGLLLARRGAPGAGTWAGDSKAEPRFVLNLPAFLEEDGFAAAGYAAAVRTGVLALEILGGAKATRLRLGFADLAGLLAALRLDYDSPEGRDVAVAVAALTRGAAEAASGRLAESLGARFPLALNWPAPPASLPVAGLVEAVRAALDEAAGAPGLRHAAIVALSPPDAVEALLGAETGGLAPAAAPTRLVSTEDGGVAEIPTRAALLAGEDAARLLAPRGPESRAAMEAALRPWLHAAAPAVAAPAQAPRPVAKPRPAPAHGRGAVWKVGIGGHRVTLRTMEGAEGLEEISLTLAKDGAAFRGVVDALCHSVTVGLASGVPLDEYVQAFAYTRFGPAGVVEGDPAIHRASSVLDWAFRRLALDHLGGRILPDPTEEECGGDHLGTAAQQLPLLPDLPSAPAPAARRRALRLVG
ncbi:TSCPD domain-containing protein [Roseomonas nepalensis]|uniref:ribonucleoside-diphosphate reductase n=1 Tax=Muricoccus nepalensis TaxID=1854500 RepID=A0A502GDK3_9PROT|nr:TSCPD domain-containing protein [Roseomonas nepalensis]TPG59116.1 TSCPD domain-containing protein [Roseomonas nepalensis]